MSISRCSKHTRYRELVIFYVNLVELKDDGGIVDLCSFLRNLFAYYLKISM